MPKAMQIAEFGHSSDAQFQAWVGIAESLLAASGLVRTSDTGQVNPATVIRPATNSFGGYSMWRFNDPLQGVFPIFVKVLYGTGQSGSTRPMLGVEIGAGSDGAGNITGLYASSSFYIGASVSGTANALYLAVANLWGCALVVGAVPGETGTASLGLGFAIHRTVDAAGEPTAEGVMLHTPANTTSSTAAGRVWFVQRQPILSTLALSGVDVAHLPFGLASYTVGVSPQVFPVWCATPKVKPMAFLAVGHANGSPVAGQTFSMAVVGAQAKTYIGLGYALGRHFQTSQSSAAGVSFVMWED